MEFSLLFDKWRRTVDPAAQNRLGHQLQQYIAEHMLMPVITTRPTIQAARDAVKGYTYMRGMKVSFESTWLDHQ